MKSIRLNGSLRAEIASNIEQAYEIATPAPKYASKSTLLSVFKAVVETEYHKQVTALKSKLTEAGVDIALVRTSCEVDVYSDKNNHFTRVLLTNEEGGREYLPKLKVSGAFIQLDMLDDYPLIAEAYATYKKSIKAGRAGQALFREWETSKRNYMSDVRNVIAGVNTTGQLLEQWEEVRKFLPDGIVNPSRIALPAVSIAQLNKKIGL